MGRGLLFVPHHWVCVGFCEGAQLLWGGVGNSGGVRWPPSQPQHPNICSELKLMVHNLCCLSTPTKPDTHKMPQAQDRRAQQVEGPAQLSIPTPARHGQQGCLSAGCLYLSPQKPVLLPA